MRRTPEPFLRSALAQKNAPVHLICIEVSKSYVTNITPYESSKSEFYISQALSDKFAAEGVYPEALDPFYYDSEYHGGQAWIVTFENGNNIGSKRLISDYFGNYIAMSQGADFSFKTSGADKCRISKCMFLAMRNKRFDFFMPDCSNSLVDVPVSYIPFPFSFTPVGTSIEGDVMSMKVDASNVNLLLGDLVQGVNGLRGNRVTHIMTFDDAEVIAQGRTSCVEENMYIDSVSITPETVSFNLETRFNIMSLQIPLCNYNRNFCRWRYLSQECLGNNPTFCFSGEAGTPVDRDGYPSVSLVKCDHSLLGPNGCAAHKNTVRYGGFPSIAAIG